MFCSKCGAEISDEAKFCSNCGNAKYDTPVVQNSNIAVSSTSKKKKIIIICVISVLALLLILVGCNQLFNGKVSKKTQEECISYVQNTYLSSVGEHYEITIGEILDWSCTDVEYNCEYFLGSYDMTITGIMSDFGEFEVSILLNEIDEKTYELSPIYVKVLYDDEDIWLEEEEVWQFFRALYEDWVLWD